MHVVAVYAVLAATPALVLYGADRALSAWSRGRPRPRRAGTPAVDPRHSLERLVADLQRLERDHRRLADSDEPGRVTRMRSVTLAYDDVLRACCRSLGLAEPAHPLTSLDRLETEAALSQQGLTW